METGRQGITGNGDASRIWKGEFNLIESASVFAYFKPQFYPSGLALWQDIRSPPLLKFKSVFAVLWIITKRENNDF